MGITIVQKSDLSKKRPRAKKALILAGGAVTGGSFKAGGILALDEYFSNFSVNDFDIFVGISSGSMLAAALLAGISPKSIVRSLDGTSRHFSELSAWHYYRPNISEFMNRPLKFIFQAAGWIPKQVVRLTSERGSWSRGMLSSVWRFLLNPTRASYEKMMRPVLNVAHTGDFPSLFELLPTGIFDNCAIEQYIRQNIERNGLTNSFRKAQRLTGKKLYISAMRLDGAKRVIFGPDENDSLTISEAVWASTALPGFYKPARINGIDYVDGGVQETASIDIAVKKGAELIVCYNPFRPYEPDEFVDNMTRQGKERKTLAAEGVVAVLNQILRAFFHARLKVALDGFRNNKKFRGDIILVEPRPDDAAFFALNPLLLRNRVEAARLGFESVRNSINDSYAEIRKILGAYGISITKKNVEKKYRKFLNPDVSDSEIQKLLEA